MSRHVVLSYSCRQCAVTLPAVTRGLLVGIALFGWLVGTSASAWAQDGSAAGAIEEGAEGASEAAGAEDADPIAPPMLTPPEENLPPFLPETVVPGETGMPSESPSPGSDSGPITDPGPFPSNPLPDTGDVVVTPSQGAQLRSTTGSSVEVITSEQLQRFGQSSVSEVLRQSVGVDVVRSGGPGGNTSVFLRGANSNHTKVLLDGIPLNDPSDPSRRFDFNTLQLDNIERIEILRGAQSTLYGSDAIGGVINIVTKRGSGPLAVKAFGMGGSFGTAQTGFTASGGTDRFYYSVGGSWLHTDGISAADRANGNTERDRYENGTISSRLGTNLTENLNIDYVFRWSDSNAGIDQFDSNPPFLPIDQIGRFVRSENMAQRVQISHNGVDGLVRQRVGFSYNDVKRLDNSPSPFERPAFAGTTQQLDYHADLDLTQIDTLSAGAVYYQETARVAASQFDLAEKGAQNMASAYLQDRITLFEQWTTTAGVRWDEHSRAGSANTYRVNTIWNIGESGFSPHGSVGTGFRAPALSENFFGVTNPFGFTNAGLRPERSFGWDAGLRKEFAEGKVWIDGTFFRNDFTDLIIFSFDPGTGGFRLLNVGESFSQGVEVTGGWQASDLWVFNGSYTFDNAFDKDANRRLLRRPYHKGTLAVTRLFPDQRAQVSAYLLYVGDRLDSDFTSPTGVGVLSSYVTLNMTASWRPYDMVELFVRGDNLTDTSYQEVLGFGVPGIAGYGGVNVYW